MTRLKRAPKHTLSTRSRLPTVILQMEKQPQYLEVAQPRRHIHQTPNRVANVVNATHDRLKLQNPNTVIFRATKNQLQKQLFRQKLRKKNNGSGQAAFRGRKTWQKTGEKVMIQTLECSLENIKQHALKLGAVDAKIIPVDKIVIEERLVLKCSLGCGNTARHWLVHRIHQHLGSSRE